MVRSAARDEAIDMAEAVASDTLIERTINVLFGLISSPSAFVEQVMHREIRQRVELFQQGAIAWWSTNPRPLPGAARGPRGSKNGWRVRLSHWQSAKIC
jgi:hypothetical protein